MILLLQVAGVALTAIVMALSLAHALDLPGKMRLGREQYLAVQTIYYPGFTIGGLAEPLCIIVLAILLLLLPAGSSATWLTAAALALLVIVQLLFWAVVQPVNRHWLQTVKLSAAAGRFFEAGKGVDSDDWISLRGRWERGHLTRSVAATLAFVAATLALAAQ